MPIQTERFDFGLEVSRNLEPRVGVEPTTCRLRIDCSTTELPRPALWTIASAEIFCQFNREIAFSHREKGYIAQPIPTPISKKRKSDHTMYFTRSIGCRRLKKPNAMEITSANSSIACK